MKKGLSVLILLLFLVPLAIAHEGEEGEEEEKPEFGIERLHATNVEQYYPISTWDALWIGLVVLSAFTLIVIIFKNHLPEPAKKFLFGVVSITMIGVTLYFAGTTIYINHLSVTGGPIHWHADYQVWVCGERLDLVNPTGLKNKIGTPIFHEHNDDRIHVEGVVLDHDHVDLGDYFHVIGGELTTEHMTYPTEDRGDVHVTNGDLCNGQPGTLQVFAYQVKNPKDHNEWVYEQVKIDDFPKYVYAPYVEVPPGDCVIFEFGPEKDRTEHKCETFEIKEKKGELRGN